MQHMGTTFEYKGRKVEIVDAFGALLFRFKVDGSYTKNVRAYKLRRNAANAGKRLIDAEEVK
jgi:hypothetical protein